jgi:hypothetical protein
MPEASSADINAAIHGSRECSPTSSPGFTAPVAEILATPITEDDARLVFAREHRRASWQELVEPANASRAIRDRQGPWDSRDTPFSRVADAIRRHYIPALKSLLDANPELLQPSVIDLARSAVNARYSPCARRSHYHAPAKASGSSGQEAPRRLRSRPLVP